MNGERLRIPVGIAGRLTRDGWLFFTTRCSRMFAYGLLSVVLVLYLVEVGLKSGRSGCYCRSRWRATRRSHFGSPRLLIG